MKRKIPTFVSDEQAEGFAATANLADYDLSGLKPVVFEFHNKAAQLHIGIPQQLLDAVEQRAQARGMPYSRYSRLLVEQAVAQADRPKP